MCFSVTKWRPFAALNVYTLAAQVVVIAAAKVIDAVLTELNDAGGQGGDELPVVTDKDQSAGIVFQRQVERLNGLHIQVVVGSSISSTLGFCKINLPNNMRPCSPPEIT